MLRTPVLGESSPTPQPELGLANTPNKSEKDSLSELGQPEPLSPAKSPTIP